MTKQSKTKPLNAQPAAKISAPVAAPVAAPTKQARYRGAGIRLVATLKANPRREPKPGTDPNKHVGRRAYDNLLAAGDKGLSVEEYRAKGGRTEDWQWDYKRGGIKLVQPDGTVDMRPIAY